MQRYLVTVGNYSLGIERKVDVRSIILRISRIRAASPRWNLRKKREGRILVNTDFEGED